MRAGLPHPSHDDVGQSLSHLRFIKIFTHGGVHRVNKAYCMHCVSEVHYILRAGL